MSRKYEELTGEFAFERNVFGQGEDRTIIAELADGTTVKGRAGEDELEAGLTYRFLGYWTNHPKYGEQFAFDSFLIAQPSGQRGVVAYLSRAPHIKRQRALILWDLYGPEAVKMVREQPNVVAAAVTGLTPERAAEAANYLAAHKALEDTTTALLELLAGIGAPKRLIDKLIERFGANAAEVVRENPYVLIHFRGVGFLKADKLYLQLGKDPSNPERIGWCAWHTLHKDSEGHTWMPLTAAYNAVEKNLTGTDAKVDVGITWALEQGKIVIREVNGQKWIAEEDRYNAEARLASFMHRAMVEGSGTTEIIHIRPVNFHRIDYTRCSRCNRRLTAETVAVLDGSPYGPECIQMVNGGENAEHIPLADWVESNQERAMVQK